jgi:subtilisin-like proprotein convertase family protein
MLNGAGWNNGAVSAADLAVDSDGTAVYVNGSLQGKGTIGPLKLPSKGTSAGFISKLNGSTGQFEWVRLTANGQTDIAVDPSDANVIYHSTANQIVRISPSGNTLWQRSFANASWAEMTAQNGSLFLAGSFSNQTILDSVTFNSAGDSDVLAARLAADTGEVEWAVRAGGTGTDKAAGIALDETDNLFLGGSFDGVATFGGDILTKSSGYAYDAFFSQLDASTGSFGQSWRFGGAGVTGVAASSSSAYVVGAFAANDADFPNGYLPTGGADEIRLYVMHVAPAADPTVPTINGFVAAPDPVEQSDPLSLSVVGMFDPNSRVTSVSFYRDVNFNRRLDVGTDMLVGTDSSAAGGWGITIPTTSLALGDQQFLAQATYDGSAQSLAVSAATFVTEPIGPSITYQSSDVPKQIRDLSRIVSTLTVPDSFTIADADVTLTISHGWTPDLDVYLIHPDGTRVELFTDASGYPNLGGMVDTTLDDDAPTSITTAVQPFTGSFRPEGVLGVLDGKSTAGVWKLEITDDARKNSGTLQAWSLKISEATMASSAALMTDAAAIDAALAVEQQPIHGRNHRPLQPPAVAPQFSNAQTTLLIDSTRTSWAAVTNALLAKWAPNSKADAEFSAPPKSFDRLADSVLGPMAASLLEQNY